MLWPVSARAVTEPTRESVVDASFMQIDEPKFLGSRLQEGTVLTDEGGRDFSIGDLRGKPLILLLSYYGCDGTCPVMNAELARVLPRVERFRLGEIPILVASDVAAVLFGENSRRLVLGLVLFRKARSLDRRASVANWLYTVAYHVALRARSEAVRRQRPTERRPSLAGRSTTRARSS